MSKSIVKSDVSFFKKNPTVVYLDSAATALTLSQYFASLEALADEGFTTVHRGANQFSDKTTVAYENARIQIASTHNVLPQEIVFTSGATAACNQVAWSWGLQHLNAGDEILVSIFEHHSSYLPWMRVAQEKGAVIRWAYPDPKTLVWKQKDFVFTRKTKVLLISAYSNVCGPVFSSEDDLRKIILKAQRSLVCVVVDGAQHAPFEAVDLYDLNPDFYMYSAHKMCGPQGVGVLYINDFWLEGGFFSDNFIPALVGGGTAVSVTKDVVLFKEKAHAFEAGTPPVLPIIAWNNVQQWYALHIDEEQEQQRLAGLIGEIIAAVRKIPGVRVLGNIPQLKKSGHLVSLVVDDVHAHDIADLLNDENIIVRAGLMCAQPLHEFLGVTASLRVSVHWYSTHTDVELFCDAFKAAVDRLRRV